MRFNFDSPSPFDVSMITNKTKFFLGDKWIYVGENKTTLARNGGVLEVDIPDIEGFLAKRETLDDGTFDWLEWGPRVN